MRHLALVCAILMVAVPAAADDTPEAVVSSRMHVALHGVEGWGRQPARERTAVDEVSIWNAIMRDETIDAGELAFLRLVFSEAPQIRIVIEPGAGGDFAPFIFNNRWSRASDGRVYSWTGFENLKRRTARSLADQMDTVEIARDFPAMDIEPQLLRSLSQRTESALQRVAVMDIAEATMVRNHVIGDGRIDAEELSLLRLLTGPEPLINLHADTGEGGRSHLVFHNVWNRGAHDQLLAMLRLAEAINGGAEGGPDLAALTALHRSHESTAGSVRRLLARHVADIAAQDSTRQGWASTRAFITASFGAVNGVEDEEERRVGRVMLHGAITEANTLLPEGGAIPRFLFSWVDPDSLTPPPSQP